MRDQSETSYIESIRQGMLIATSHWHPRKRQQIRNARPYLKDLACIDGNLYLRILNSLPPYEGDLGKLLDNDDSLNTSEVIENLGGNM